METYTKEYIKEKLSNDRQWIERSLVVLYDNQTKEEQRNGGTIMFNGIGYNGVDSRYLSYCSEWVISGKHLSGKHLEKCGRILPKYWKQIQRIIQQKNK